MHFPCAPRLSQIYSRMLTETNLMLNDLPSLQSLDKKYSQGTNGKFTLVGLIILIPIVMFNLFGSPLSLFIGFYYPAIRSITAIKTTSIVEYHRWTTYWLIFLFTSTVVKIPYDLLLGFFPYPQLWRIGVHVYLFHPKTDAAYKIYVRVIKQYLKKYRKQKVPAKPPNHVISPQQAVRLSLNLQKDRPSSPKRYSDNSTSSM